MARSRHHAFKIPAAVDVDVGNRIKEHRKRLGLTQSALAAVIGITFQQVQKYENGRNRVGSSRLVQIAHALRIPPSTLFGEAIGDKATSAIADADTEGLTAFIWSEESRELNLAFANIKSEAVRRAIVTLLKAVARQQQAFNAYNENPPSSDADLESLS